MHLPVHPRWLLLAALSIASGAAHALLIVDTGVPTDTTNVYPVGSAVGFSAGRAATFTVSAATRITGAEGYMQVLGTGTLTVSLYAGTPFGTPLFSQDAVRGPSEGSPYAWVGVQGLNWNVAAGDYVLAFTSPDTFVATMAGAAPNPLGAEWTRGNGNWVSQDSMDLGIRISAVPEVSSDTLLAAGLAGLAAPVLRRRRAAREADRLRA